MSETAYGVPQPVADGPFAGWMTWGLGADPFETANGPFYLRREGDGSMTGGFLAETRHLNAGGMIHGGALMTFADFALFAHALDALEGKPGVTVAFNGEFVGAGVAGAVVTSVGEVVRNTRSLIFARGTLYQNDAVIFAWTGIIKKMKG